MRVWRAVVRVWRGCCEGCGGAVVRVGRDCCEVREGLL